MTWNINDLTPAQVGSMPTHEAAVPAREAPALPSRLLTATLPEDLAMPDLDTRLGAALCQAHGWWTPRETQQRRRAMTRGIIAWSDDAC